MTVRVAIDLSLDKLFTYAVPVELEKKLAVGQLLLVPFGHREARGFAMELGSNRAGLGSNRVGLESTLTDPNPTLNDPN